MSLSKDDLSVLEARLERVRADLVRVLREGAPRQTIDAAAVIALQPEVDARQGRYRPRRSKEMETRSVGEMRQPVAAVESLNVAPHIADHGIENGPRNVAATEALGQRYHADGQRCPGNDVVCEAM